MRGMFQLDDQKMLEKMPLQISLPLKKGVSFLYGTENHIITSMTQSLLHFSNYINKDCISNKKLLNFYLAKTKIGSTYLDTAELFIISYVSTKDVVKDTDP